MNDLLYIEGNKITGYDPNFTYAFVTDERDLILTAELHLPDDIQDIGDDAFHGCAVIHKIVISSHVKHIGSRAFYGCKYLKEIAFEGEGVNIVFEPDSFVGCPAKKIFIESLNYSVEGCTWKDLNAIPFSIREYFFLFYGCSSLESIETPQGEVKLDEILESNKDSLLQMACYYHTFGIGVSYFKGMPTRAKSFKDPSPDSYKARTLADPNDVSYILRYNWKVASGLGALLGHNRVRALDIDDCRSDIVDKSLELLGLTKNYQWVVNTGSRAGAHILFRTDDVNEDISTKTFGPNYVHEFRFRLLELRWNDDLVLPSSLHPSGNRYEFWSKHLPSSPLEEIAVSKVNDLLDYFSGIIRFVTLDYEGKKIQLAIPEKIYSVFGSGSWTPKICVDDSIEWLKECKSPRAKTELALKYVVYTSSCRDEDTKYSILKEFDKGLVRELLEQAGEYPAALHNLASFIACGIIYGTEQEVNDCLNKLPKKWNGDLEIIRGNLKSFSQNNLQESSLPDCKYYCFFDTETTGLPKDYDAPASKLDNWPRLVQLSWIMTDEKGKVVSTHDHIIKPKGFYISDSAASLHNITQSKEMSEGEILETVLSLFVKDIASAQCVIGHNVDFDKRIVSAELIRCGMKDSFEGKKTFCTMKNTVEFCSLPGLKYPKLQELYEVLFGEEYDNDHSALSDADATVKCYWELRKLGVLDEDNHLAKRQLEDNSTIDDLPF